MRIGLFGGSFDPPHRGHERALEAFIRETELDLCYVVPAGISPSKEILPSVSAQMRLAMTKAAFEPMEKVKILTNELESELPSYTYITVEKIREIHPDDRLFLFVGTDQFLVFESWKRVEYLLAECTLCVMDRYRDAKEIRDKKQALEKKFAARTLLLEEKAYIISSSDIREELEELGFSHALSPSINEFISLHGLYGTSCGKRGELLSRLKKEVGKDRLSHTLGVERETDRLCRLIALSEESRREVTLAALYHDLTKEKSTEEQISLLARFGEQVEEADVASPAVLHGKTAAHLAEKEGLSPNAVDAIRYHTTGRADMDWGEKILFFADYIEETRVHKVCRDMRKRFYSRLPQGAESCRQWLDVCITEVLEHTAVYLREKNLPCHPLGEAALYDMKEKRKESL